MSVVGETLRGIAELCVKLADLEELMEAASGPPPLTVDAAAKALDVSTDTVYRQILRGDLEAFKVGSQWRIPVRAIASLLGDAA